MQRSDLDSDTVHMTSGERPPHTLRTAGAWAEPENPSGQGELHCAQRIRSDSIRSISSSSKVVLQDRLQRTALPCTRRS